MTQSFTLVLPDEVDENEVEEIYELIPDSSVSVDSGATLIGIDREDIDDPLEAIASAIAQVEAATGKRVERVEPDELVYATEIAERINRSRQSVDLLIRGMRGPGNFPAPHSHASGRNPLWRWSDVETWFHDYEHRDVADGAVALGTAIGAVNGLLETRRYAEWFSKDSVMTVLEALDRPSIRKPRIRPRIAGMRIARGAPDHDREA